jgi:alpha-galactosidase
MRLVPDRVEVRGAAEGSERWTGDGTVHVGAVEVEVLSDRDAGWSWSVANRGDGALAVDAVALVLRVVDVAAPLRMFRNGYQSWSPTGMATFGVDGDPSLTAGARSLVIGMHHADPAVAQPGELRSELFTVVLDASSDPSAVLGFAGGSEHDGTFRLRAGERGPELWIEAFLGGAVLAPGEQRSLHACSVAAAADPFAALDAWAAGMQSSGARTGAPYQVGWCSWYHYFHDVTEADLRHNLARAGDWPFDVFQLDDGYQAAIGDWLETNDRFPSSLDVLATDIAAAGFRPGLWIAPFLAAPDARVVTEHPDWVARRRSKPDEPLWCWYNPPWGGGQRGFMYGLDTTNPEVLDHLAQLAADLVDAGFTYLKLDFTFAPSVDGIWSDPSRTPAQRVRAGYEAVRRGAGTETFLLGCGVPLANVVGLVDANRIGQDVAPRWAIDPADETVPGYLAVQPAVRHAYVNTLTRSFMHRRLWLNDPDCLMLRTDQTDLTPTQLRTWARTVGVSGGLALVSDDLALLGDDARSVLDEALAIGRRSDDAAMDGQPATCPDLFVSAEPTMLDGGGYSLVTDPETAESTLEAPG